MPKVMAVIFCAIFWFASSSQLMHAQETEKQKVTETKPSHPDRERMQKWMEAWSSNENLQRDQIESDLRKAKLNYLENRHKQVKNSIENVKDNLKILKKPLIFHYELSWRDKKGVRRGVPFWPWDKPEANLPLWIHDKIETWIPLFERDVKKDLKPGEAYRYTLNDIWHWRKRQQANRLKMLENEIEELPERIKDARRTSSEADEKLKEAMLAVSRSINGPAGENTSTETGRKPADIWVGKWNYRIRYAIVNKTFDMLFQVIRRQNNYSVVIVGPKGDISPVVAQIDKNFMELKFNDPLNTGVYLRLTGPDSFEGSLTIPNERPSGSITARRQDPAAAPRAQ